MACIRDERKAGHNQGSRPQQVEYVADAVDALSARAANASDDTDDQTYGDMSQRQLPIILALGTTQTLAWASSYYLPALLADPMAHDLGISTNWIFGAFSASLVISALLGPRIGRQIDLVGGRQVLSVSNLTIAAGLVLLGLSQSVAVMAMAWLVLGIGMAMGLYDAAFAALGRIYGTEARRPITGITLMAGFASTVGWPLTAWGLAHIGWRDTCFAWAAANILIGLPLNFFLLPTIKGAKQAAATAVKPHLPLDRTMILLAFVFAAVWTVTGAMAAHFPRILEATGATPVEAIAAGAFALFHGSGNGILTIARGTLPLSIFGPKDFGYRLGIIGAPARMAQAVAPLAFGLLIDVMGAKVLIVSSALSLSALAALFMIRTSARPD